MPVQFHLDKVLFLDIETVPQYASYKEQPDFLQQLWDKKAKNISRLDESFEELFQRAGIYAEFGKIICISVGTIKHIINQKTLRIKSFYGDDEKTILIQFSELLDQHFNSEQNRLCAHNGKEFDFPYICRRLLVNNLPIPDILDIQGKKPWEIKHLDTMELWKFGDYKHYTSLELLAHTLGIQTPKDDIDGSEVAKVYWKNNDIQRIVAYCQKDVITIAQIMLKYLRMSLLNKKEIVFV